MYYITDFDAYTNWHSITLWVPSFINRLKIEGINKNIQNKCANHQKNLTFQFNNEIFILIH